MDRGGAGFSDGVVVDRSRRRFATAPRCEIHDDPDDDDLLFDMEYDESDRDRRKRSASADSFRSCHNKNVGGVEFSVDDYDGGGQEQEVGDRSQVARVRSFKLRQEEWYGSLPGHHNSSRHRRNISDISHLATDYRDGESRGAVGLVHIPHHHLPPPLAAFSVPAAGHHWDTEDSPGLASPEYSMSSLSSVEEATEYHGTDRRKTFNHLDIEDQNGVSQKSPRFLPKFLRASFSKLLKDNHKPRNERHLRGWAVSTPVSRSPSINLDNNVPDLEINIPDPMSPRAQQSCIEHVSPDCSPTTGQFVQDCLAKGLPIIPFNYSTAEIVEKRRQSQRRKVPVVVTDRSRDNSRSRDTGAESPPERTPAPEWSEVEREEDKSLEGLLTLARREMEQEAQLRKISGITGYASNNSRALQRRRSSVSEYVKSQDEEDDTSTRVVRHPSKRRLRKHVLRQESYEDRSPLYYFNHSDVLRDSGVCCSNAHVHARRAASLDQYLDMNCPDHHKDVV